MAKLLDLEACCEVVKHTIYDKIDDEDTEQQRKDKLTGLVKWVYDDGKLRGYVSFINGIREGCSEWWYESGQLELYKVYLHGERNGEYIWYHENGKLGIRQYYQNGELQGESRWWYASGIPRWHRFYLDGERDGVYKLWCERGILGDYGFYRGDRVIADLNLRIVMSLLHFKNRLRIRVREKIINACHSRPYGMPLIPSHIVAGYCI